MSATSDRKSVTELDEALRLLDHELEQLKLDAPLQIRAIGGYALMKHGVRTGDRAYTVDIDTVTKDYSAAVMRAIQTVASRAGLAEDWLNNYNVMDNDPEQVENMIGAEWVPQPMGLRNIAVEIATIETLTRSKIVAVDGAEFSGREQDAPDLLDLMKYQGIANARQFAAKYPDPYGEYPGARDVVSRHFAPTASRDAVVRHVYERFPELRDDNLDELGLADDFADDDLHLYR